ncbi:helix-turn-helix transcriptional regulator [Actinomadura macrotermitis]|uniref:Uncharacterized protein n=1 Tax=Actinomadura macrotermitis TaxID=2585200 RepID=A0A7K0BSE8_9ACTN|nr:helix-turn-helix transcriptional regulator [Actinomadura macrotermitis]MQY04123.1 hypothetical protein [Actinomadura macrotermitis]
MSETTEPLTVNQVVAYNLARARKLKGWTQDDTAVRLSEVTGRRWTSATLGAAERSWQTGRTREFNANELAAFAKVFEQPIPFFFLPVGLGDPPTPDEYPWYPDPGPYAMGSSDQEAATIKANDLLHSALATAPNPVFVALVNKALEKYNLVWSPSRLDWYRPEEWFDGEKIDRSPAPLENEIARRLHELLRLVEPDKPVFPPPTNASPNEDPPF